MVRQGAQLTPGMPLMKLADLSKVWIVVEVPEAQAPPSCIPIPKRKAPKRAWMLLRLGLNQRMVVSFLDQIGC